MHVALGVVVRCEGRRVGDIRGDVDLDDVLSIEVGLVVSHKVLFCIDVFFFFNLFSSWRRKP